VLPAAEQKAIDRALIEYPGGYELRPFLRNLTGPTSIAFDGDGSILIAEGTAGVEPRVYGFRPNGSRFDVYPHERRLPLPFGIGRSKFRLYGPIGGMAVHGGKVYVSHRDRDRKGMITALGYDGTRQTIVADLPAQGDYGVTDLAFSPTNGRLYFGIGTATNSGVVGTDNWASGWVRQHPNVRDLPPSRFRLRGLRFDSANPNAGLFGGGEKAVTGPFQAFDISNKTWVDPPADGKYNGAIYSMPAEGGDLRLEAFGIRLPRGIAFIDSGRPYFTNNGMELRGTRPVKDDPDALLRLVQGKWYGWPDFSTDFYPITDPRFRPPLGLIANSGFQDLSFIIDHEASGRNGRGLIPPDRDRYAVQATFPSQSGAAKLAMAPRAGAFSEFFGSAIVTLGGDRAPFATGGQKLLGPVGYKVTRVNLDTKETVDFIRNTAGVPARLTDRKTPDELERPVDVKFGPDGALYVLDMGRMEVRNGREVVVRGTGQIFRLVPTTAAMTEPAPAEPDPEAIE
jgi:glucose/arabinose dehydrogenase